MYAYKRFKISKWSLTITLIALALVAWGILGLTGTPLAGRREEVTFELKYSPTSDVAFIGGPVFDANGTLHVTKPISPGSNGIEEHHVLLDLSYFDGIVGTELTALDQPRPFWQIGEKMNDPGTADTYYYFTDVGSGVVYELYLPGTFVGNNLIPAPGGTTTVVGEDWELKVAKGKRKGVGGPWNGDLDWTLKITRE